MLTYKMKVNYINTGWLEVLRAASHVAFTYCLGCSNYIKINIKIRVKPLISQKEHIGLI